MTGYGGPHQAIRRAVAPYVAGAPCCRCGLPILPGQPWDLDHDDDRGGYRGPAHARCNRRAGGRLGAARKKARRQARSERITRMMTDCVLGIEISESRHKTSVAAAAWLPEPEVSSQKDRLSEMAKPGATEPTPDETRIAVVELALYLDGTDTVPAILALRAARTVLAMVIDPHSPAATLIRPLTDAGVTVTEPTSSALAVAHGLTLDLLTAGRLRHTGQPELTAAMRHGAARRLGGAQAFERRGNTVDVSPAVAAELAVWGLLTMPVTPAPFFLAEWR